MRNTLTTLLLATTLWASAQQVVSLAGIWEFASGTDGQPQRTNDEPPTMDDFVVLPGSMLTNDKGTPVSTKTQWTGSLYDSSYYFNPFMARYRAERQADGGTAAEPMKLPFFLTPERHFVGTAWYRRTVYVPKTWNTSSQRITLFLERPHIETTVWVNGQPVGHQMSLSVPHVYDVTRQVKPGELNTILIKVYNGIDNVCVGQDSHSVTDQTQGNWNGIAGRMELQACPRLVTIDRVRVYPDVDSAKAHVVVTFDREAALALTDYELQLFKKYGLGYELSYSGVPTSHTSATMPGGTFPTLWTDNEGKPCAMFDINLGSYMETWDEFSPVVYRLTVTAGDDAYTTTFGMRSVKVEGRQLLINGRPLFLRGTVENCLFPETGYPPTNAEEWTRIFQKCKEYGLNHVRFHSYCPPEAAFVAADQVGIYLQPEGPSWPNHGVRLRRGMAIDKYLLDESKRIVDTYGNHPSFLMMAAGNEPAGDWVSYCNDWVRQMRQYDPTKLYCGASVGGGWAWDPGSDYHVKGGARGLDEWNRTPPSSDTDFLAGITFPRNYRDTVPNNSPIIAHEQGQWCAFPDFSELPQYTGVYKARSFEIFRDLLQAGGMATQDRKFLMASGKLQTLCYKHEIERNLRTPGYAGFQLLSLNDYSGQGTALVGPLNVHWREKGYVNAQQWREFCNIVVPLARFPKFVYTNSDTLSVPIEAYNAYATDLSGIRATYFISDDSMKVIGGGMLAQGVLPVGKNTSLGKVTMPLSGFNKPTKLTLVVQIAPQLTNRWDFWVYPSQTVPDGTAVGKAPTGILITDTLDARALRTLRQGGTVLIEAAGKVRLGSDVKQTYLPVFWNTSWFKMRPPHTTGAYIDKSHPLFSHGFPTDDWANLNWWELLNRAQVMNLRELPADYQPPIQPIDTWHVSRKLAMLIEARVGKGRLLMTTMDISTDLDHRVVARQMRQAILSYMKSSDFKPTIALKPEVIGHFFTQEAPPVDMFTKDSPDELKPKLTN